MNTFTTNYDEWDTTRRTVFQDHGLHVQELKLDVPEPVRSQFKGFTTMPVFEADDEIQLCKTWRIGLTDSILNYDWSNCYLRDYFLITSESRALDPDTLKVDMEKPSVRNTTVMMRYSGEPQALYPVVQAETAE